MAIAHHTTAACRPVNAAVNAVLYILCNANYQIFGRLDTSEKIGKFDFHV
jgi:hypothetical protein